MGYPLFELIGIDKKNDPRFFGIWVYEFLRSKEMNRNE